MTLRERILAVYNGRTPDVVPFMLDLSHYFYHRENLPWDLSQAYHEPEYALIDYHKKMGAGFYMPNLAALFEVQLPPDVEARTEKSEDARTITWTLETPSGAISRSRRWEPGNYSWGMAAWGVRTRQDLQVLAEAMENRTFSPRWDRYQQWVEYVGDAGVVYISPGYSAMGHLLNYWMGVEGTLMACMEMPDVMHDVVDRINSNLLDLIDLLAQSPAEVVIGGDNFSSDLQPPSFFQEWSKPFYDEMVRRLHAGGKAAAVHIDGRLRGSVGMIAATGADCGDAITPGLPGDLTPQGCRGEGGDDFILSGGPAPNLWLPHVSVEDFRAAVLEWLELRRRSPRLIAAAGDQVPPGAEEDRIRLMRDLVEERGRY